MKRAFTLIELLVVISVVSLLSSVIFSSVSSAREKANNAHKASESSQVRKAIELYAVDNNGLMPSFASSSTSQLHQEGSSEYNEAMQELVDGGYLASIPASPSGDSYAYMVSDDETSAVFYADQDEEVGGEDVCRYVGDHDFGQTGSGDSCDGVVSNEGGTPTYCGQPPYLVKLGQSQNIYGDWEVDIDAVDPEGSYVYFDSWYWEPNSGFECYIPFGTTDFPLQATCSDYGGGSYVDMVLTGITTTGCSLEHDVTDFITIDII